MCCRAASGSSARCATWAARVISRGSRRRTSRPPRKNAPLDNLSALIPQVRPQPLLRLLHTHPLALRVVLHLVLVDLAHREIVRVRMSDIPAAHRGRGIHRKGISDSDTRVAFDIE